MDPATPSYALGLGTWAFAVSHLVAVGEALAGRLILGCGAVITTVAVSTSWPAALYARMVKAVDVLVPVPTACQPFPRGCSRWSGSALPSV